VLTKFQIIALPSNPDLSPLLALFGWMPGLRTKSRLEIVHVDFGFAS
jgi:hypothetical protein